MGREGAAGALPAQRYVVCVSSVHAVCKLKRSSDTRAALLCASTTAAAEAEELRSLYSRCNLHTHTLVRAETPTIYSLFVNVWHAVDQPSIVSSYRHRCDVYAFFYVVQFFAFAFPLKLFQVINIKHMRTSLFSFTSTKTYVCANINSHIPSWWRRRR